MPFYKKSSIFEILKTLGIESKLNLAKVDKIAFYSGYWVPQIPQGNCGPAPTFTHSIFQ